MNKQELIERIEDFPCEASLVTEMIRINKNTLLGWVKELDLSQPIKLKDVIARIKIFDVGTQKVWLNEILVELGSDYGTLKYKAGYEQGKLEGEWVGQQLKDADKIRQELNKPVVPQFVADWYEGHKDDFEGNLFRCIDRMPDLFSGEELSDFEEWIVDDHTKPFQILVNMHQFGYTVEKEKRYLVKIRGFVECGDYFNYFVEAGYWAFSGPSNHPNVRTYHTRKELEEAGLSDVFNSPLFEVEEVE